MTIKPLVCADFSLSPASDCFEAEESSSARVIKVYNKKRERLRFDVPAKLTLQGIVIDSIDSVLHSLADVPACLSLREKCCEFNSSTNTVDTVGAGLDGSLCQSAFDTLFSTMEVDCFANWPRSMFKMRLTDELNGISSPNELEFSAFAGVQNTFYAMNSLVAFSSAGGVLTTNQAHFSHLHLCGSIAKDSYTDLGAPDLRVYVSEKYLTSAQLEMLETIRGYEAAIGGKTPKEYYMDTVAESTRRSICSTDGYCTQILIKNDSIFEDIPFGQSVRSQPLLVSEENGLRYQGYIVTLDSGNRSSLEVFNSEFHRIKAPFDGCGPYESLIAIDDSRV